MAVYHFLQTSSAWLSDFASRKDRMYAAKLGRPWPTSEEGDKGWGHVAERDSSGQEGMQEKGEDRKRKRGREKEGRGQFAEGKWEGDEVKWRGKWQVDVRMQYHMYHVMWHYHRTTQQCTVICVSIQLEQTYLTLLHAPHTCHTHTPHTTRTPQAVYLTNSNTSCGYPQYNIMNALTHTYVCTYIRTYMLGYVGEAWQTLFPSANVTALRY